MTKVVYQNKTMTIVDINPMNPESFILVEPPYSVIYEETGIDTKESILKIDYNIAKVYASGDHVYYVIDSDTGLAVGYYGVHRHDPELELVPATQ